MAELARDLDLAQEPLGAERGGELRAHHLHRHLALVLLVLGQVDGGHAALAEDPLHLVAAGECLGHLRDLERTSRCEPRRHPWVGRGGDHRSACKTALPWEAACDMPDRLVPWLPERLE